MDLKYLQRVAGYIALALAAVILIVDIAYQLAGALVNTVETMPLSMVSEEKVFTSDGYVVRTEQTITTDTAGIVSPAVSDGTKIAAGDQVAEIYGDSPKQAQQFAELKRALNQQALLNEAFAKKNAYSQTTADREIARLTAEIQQLTASGKTENLQTLTDALQVMMYIREMKVGKDLTDAKNALDDRVEELKALVGGALSAVYADRGGYYYNQCDGYEDYLSVSDLEEADSALLGDLLEKKLEPQELPDSAGKIVTDYVWSVVIKLPFTQAQALGEGKSYPIMLSGLADSRLTMKLDRKVSEYESDDVYLIFSCTEQPVGFAYSRYQTVSVVMGTAEGFRIPVGALRVLNGVTGVYVLKGSVVEFREVSPIMLSDGTVLADAVAEPTADFPALKYYDILVVRGKELYVGKIVEH